MTEMHCDVAIVGAAVAGGSLAAALRGSGLSVVVVEAQPKIPVINRGDQLAPPIVAYLASLGLLRYFEARGAERVHRWRAYGPEGELLAQVDLRDILDPPYNYIMTLPHPEIHGAFMDAIADSNSTTVIRGSRVSALVRDADGTVVGLRAKRGDSELTISAKIVAGCDGLRSSVRELGGISTDVQYYDEFPMITATRHPDQDGDVNWEAWTPRGFLGVYPISKTYVRCPVQAESGELTRWREIGFDRVKDELAEKFPWFEQMTIVDEGLHVYKSSRHNAASYVGDGVVLIGEAAHTTPPFYGFGMAMAIRDSREAAVQIAECIRERDVSANMLKPYEQRVVDYNLWATSVSTMYRDVATGMFPTAGELQDTLQRMPALDPAIMSRLYGDW